MALLKKIDPYACIRPGLILMAVVGLVFTY